jgi:SpoVK/Ycf46/Vps4 family AAA+-type ATPase
MSLRQEFSEYVRACFTGVWIESFEHPEALMEISQLCRDESWQLATWDCESGLSTGSGSEAVSASDPVSAIRAVGSLARPDSTVILTLPNFHRFLQSAEVIQALARQVVAGRTSRVITVILAPVLQMPVELEKLFVVLPHPLPASEELLEIARGVATEPGELPEESDLQKLLDASAGLTRMEAENAFSLSLVRSGKITPETVWEMKSQMLKKSGLVTLYRGQDDFSSLGGLASLKAFCKQALKAQPEDDPTRLARGVLLLSPPGCGKSQFCKALGREVGRPVLHLDVGSLMGALVGQSEERTRQALRLAEAMAPCVLMLDEVEKAFSGLNGQGDSGVASRMFGTFLSWLNDHSSNVFVVCTANDVTRLPPEFGRSERFDGVFFLDLPDRAEKDAIWAIYRRLYEIDLAERQPVDTNWTGAEIRSCCRLARLLHVPLTDSAQNVVPVAVTAAESINRLRTWASGRCLSANQSGVYQAKVKNSTARRNVSREPSVN